MLRTPRSILFDLGRVIVPFDFARGYSRMSALSGLDPAEIRRRIAADSLVSDYECGKYSTEEFVARLTGRLDLKLTVAEFLEIWSSIFEPHTLIPDSLPAGLKRQGYRLVLLSNTNDMHFNWVRPRYPILDHFDAFVLSHQVGAQKPSPEIYRVAVEAAGVPAEECFFTDDIPEYVEGAKRAGIDAVRFESYEQLRGELLARGVAVD